MKIYHDLYFEPRASPPILTPSNQNANPSSHRSQNKTSTCPPLLSPSALIDKALERMILYPYFVSHLLSNHLTLASVPISSETALPKVSPNPPDLRRNKRSEPGCVCHPCHVWCRLPPSLLFLSSRDFTLSPSPSYPWIAPPQLALSVSLFWLFLQCGCFPGFFPMSSVLTIHTLPG